VPRTDSAGSVNRSLGGGRGGAGTFQRIYYRLLNISLSIHRVSKGNTYTRLDTERLFCLLGAAAPGKWTQSADDPHHKEAISYLVRTLRDADGRGSDSAAHYLLRRHSGCNRCRGQIRDESIRLRATYAPIDWAGPADTGCIFVLRGARHHNPFSQPVFLLVTLSYLQAHIGREHKAQPSAVL